MGHLSCGKVLDASQKDQKKKKNTVHEQWSNDFHTLPDFPFLESFKSYFLDSVLSLLLGKCSFQDLLPAGRVLVQWDKR